MKIARIVQCKASICFSFWSLEQITRCDSVLLLRIMMTWCIKYYWLFSMHQIKKLISSYKTVSDYNWRSTWLKNPNNWRCFIWRFEISLSLGWFWIKPDKLWMDASLLENILNVNFSCLKTKYDDESSGHQTCYY